MQIPRSEIIDEMKIGLYFPLFFYYLLSDYFGWGGGAAIDIFIEVNVNSVSEKEKL